MWQRVALVLMVAVALGLAASPLLAVEIHVAPDGSGDAPTIQAAVEAAASDDTIVLADGVFTGPGNRDLTVRVNRLTIRSASGDPLSCSLDLEGHRGFIRDAGTDFNLTGVTVRNGVGAGNGSAIQVTSGRCAVSHCQFLDNSSFGRGGAIAARSMTMEDCLLSGNFASQEGAALDLRGESTVTRCTFAGNAGPSTVHASSAVNGHEQVFSACSFIDNSGDNGVLHLDSTVAEVIGCLFARNDNVGYHAALWIADTFADIRECTFADNGGLAAADIEIWESASGYMTSIRRCVLAYSRASYAVVNDITDPPLVECTDIYTAGAGWPVTIAAQEHLNGNLDLNPVFCDRENGNYAVADISPCLPSHNGCGVQIGRFGQGCATGGFVVYPDGHGVLADIQTAIATVPAGGEVLLADGTFSGEGNRDLDFDGKAVTLRSLSDNPAACIIDAGGTARGFRFQTGEGSATVVRGITIRNGWSESAGGAALVESASPWFVNCRFEASEAVFGGGLAATAGAWPVLRDCVFYGNQAYVGAAISAQDASIDAYSCTAAGNQSAGAALFVQGGVLRLEQTIVAQNTGLAAWVDPEATIYLAACDLFGNEGGDWTAPFASQLDLRDNFLAPPCFCDLEAGVLTLCADSWCLPENNPLGNGLLVGTLGVGCEGCGCGGPVAAEVSGLVAQPRPGGVVVRWNAPAHRAEEFGLTAMLDGATWAVTAEASDDGFVATDEDPRLTCGGRVTYRLTLDGAEMGEVAVEVPPLAGIALAAHPNPFNPATSINYRVDQAGPVSLVVFDLRGRRVTTLLQASVAAGDGQVTWNGRDDEGRAVEAGTYLCRLECAGGVRTVPLALVK